MRGWEATEEKGPQGGGGRPHRDTQELPAAPVQQAVHQDGRSRKAAARRALQDGPGQLVEGRGGRAAQKERAELRLTDGAEGARRR